MPVACGGCEQAYNALRKQTVERMFGIIKSVLGFRRFSCRIRMDNPFSPGLPTSSRLAGAWVCLAEMATRSVCKRRRRGAQRTLISTRS